MSIQALLLRPLRKRLGTLRRFDVQEFYTYHRRCQTYALSGQAARLHRVGSPALRLQRQASVLYTAVARRAMAMQRSGAMPRSVHWAKIKRP